MPDPGQIFVLDDITTRIRTDLREREREPCLLVERIEWDSGFRGSALRIGDRIVAAGGTPVAALVRDAVSRGNRSEVIGGYAEAQYWARTGAKEGTPVMLTVRRRQKPKGWQTEEVAGTLRAGRSYRDARNSPTLWPGGPNNYERDGFYQGWPEWYEALQKLITEALNERWRRPSYVSQYELKTLLEQAPRVEMLTTKYAGPFAETVRQDFDAAVASARGAIYTLTGEDLAYRRADEERVAELASLGKARFDAAVASEPILPAFPAPHPIHTPHEGRVGQRVLLPDIPTEHWINDGDLSFLIAGSAEQGWYTMSIDAPPAQRLFTALRRYQRRVNPNIRERYTLLARILPEARIVVFSGQGCWCWQVEPLAAWIGDAMYVDVTSPQAGVSLFAGEEGLLKPSTDVPADDAPPEEVLEAMIASLKTGDLTVWKQLFATWQLRRAEDGHPQVRYHVWDVRENDFEASRRSFATRLFDARVNWVGDVDVITTGEAFAGAPRLEEVEAVIEHVGVADGEYRAFNDVTVRRLWQLQRLNGGPWRIASMQQI